MERKRPHCLELGLRFSEFRQDFEGFYGFVVSMRLIAKPT